MRRRWRRRKPDLVDLVALYDTAGFGEASAPSGAAARLGMMMPNLARAIRLALSLCLLASPALAGPWIDPGDTGLRHDLQILADAGIIGSPLSVWPLAWGDIASELDAQPGNAQRLSDAAAEALGRVRARLRDARVVGHWTLRAEASAGSDPRLIRDFEDTPRAKGELGVAAEWTGDRFAVNLAGQYAADPQDGDELRADGSYAGLVLGNWMFAAAMTDRWWGPGWQGSLILSNNARPIPAFTIDRNSTAPFETKWLHWLGHWDFVTMFGFLEHDRVVPDTQFFGMRFTARPARWLEFGLSRTAMWCGEGRPCGFDTFKDMLLGKDNAGDNVSAADEPGDQLAGYDLRLSGASLGVPVAVYTQRIGEDEQNLKPALFLTQFGMETWGGLGSLGTYRVYLEVSDTLCGGNVYGSGKADCAYNHPIYHDRLSLQGAEHRPFVRQRCRDLDAWGDAERLARWLLAADACQREPQSRRRERPRQHRDAAQEGVSECQPRSPPAAADRGDSGRSGCRVLERSGHRQR